MSKKSTWNIPGIYTITNLQTGVVYVGQARNIRKRWEVHRSTLRSGSHRNCYLQRAWNKYGEGAFAFKVHLDLSPVSLASLGDALNDAEIKTLSAFTETYNLMEAGFSGTVASDETRALLSAQRKALWADAAFRKKRSEAARALHADPDFKARHASAVAEGKRTPEARATMSNRTKQLWASDTHREEQSRRRVANWQDPAYRQRQADSRKASWADPQKRANRVAGLKASWARRKAATSGASYPPPASPATE